MRHRTEQRTLSALVLLACMLLCGQGLAQQTPVSTQLPPALRVDPYGYEIATLKSQRPSLFKPIALICLSGGLAASSLLFTGLAYLVETRPGSSDTHDGAGGGRDRAFREARPLLSAAAVGAAIAGAGIGWLVYNVRRRRPLNARIHELRYAQSLFPALSAPRAGPE